MNTQTSVSVEDIARQWLKNNVRSLGLIPKNTTQYFTCFLSAAPRVSPTLGVQVAPSVQTGKVVHVDERYSILKTDRIKFAIVDHELLEAPLDLGRKVQLTPYVPRDFDGIPLNSISKDEQETYGSTGVFVIGMRRIEFPCKAQSVYMEQMFDLLCKMRMPDGQRVIAHALVDAGARRENIEVFDSDAECKISMKIDGSKFKGKFTFGLDFGADLYWIELESTEGTNRIDDVYFEDVAGLVAEHISDEACLAIKTAVLG